MAGEDVRAKIGEVTAGLSNITQRNPRTGGVTGEFLGEGNVIGTQMFSVPDLNSRTGREYMTINSDQLDAYLKMFKAKLPNAWKSMRDMYAVTDAQLTSAIKTSADWTVAGLVNTDAIFGNVGLAIGASVEDGGGAGGVSTQAYTYGEQAARNIGNNAWVNELGREMTDREAKAFAKAINAAARSNPSVATSGETKTGFSPEQFTQDYARSQEGWAERQVGINFMDVLDKAISQPTQMGNILAGGE